jgi:hypothetical protein
MRKPSENCGLVGSKDSSRMVVGLNHVAGLLNGSDVKATQV